MTVEEFDKTRFGAGDKARYKGENYLIGSVDFEERLIALYENNEEYTWVRCENIEFIPFNKN